jgi:hypothetical protein
MQHTTTTIIISVLIGWGIGTYVTIAHAIKPIRASVTIKLIIILPY